MRKLGLLAAVAALMVVSATALSAKPKTPEPPGEMQDGIKVDEGATAKRGDEVEVYLSVTNTADKKRKVCVRLSVEVNGIASAIAQGALTLGGDQTAERTVNCTVPDWAPAGTIVTFTLEAWLKRPNGNPVDSDSATLAIVGDC